MRCDPWAQLLPASHLLRCVLRSLRSSTIVEIPRYTFSRISGSGIRMRAIVQEGYCGEMRPHARAVDLYLIVANIARDVVGHIWPHHISSPELPFLARDPVHSASRMQANVTPRRADDNVSLLPSRLMRLKSGLNRRRGDATMERQPDDALSSAPLATHQHARYRVSACANSHEKSQVSSKVQISGMKSSADLNFPSPNR